MVVKKVVKTLIALIFLWILTDSGTPEVLGSATSWTDDVSCTNYLTWDYESVGEALAEDGGTNGHNTCLYGPFDRDNNFVQKEFTSTLTGEMTLHVQAKVWQICSADELDDYTDFEVIDVQNSVSYTGLYTQRRDVYNSCTGWSQHTVSAYDSGDWFYVCYDNNWQDVCFKDMDVEVTFPSGSNNFIIKFWGVMNQAANDEAWGVSDVSISIDTPAPTDHPSLTPTINPTNNPSIPPTKYPTNDPSVEPTQVPSVNPTINPTLNPSVPPTVNPSVNPTTTPSLNPSVNPTINPTLNPSVNPTINPTLNPTIEPTLNPSVNPTTTPSKSPTISPTPSPTIVWTKVVEFRSNISVANVLSDAQLFETYKTELDTLFGDGLEKYSSYERKQQFRYYLDQIGRFAVPQSRRRIINKNDNNHRKLLQLFTVPLLYVTTCNSITFTICDDLEDVVNSDDFKTFLETAISNLTGDRNLAITEVDTDNDKTTLSPTPKPSDDTFTNNDKKDDDLLSGLVLYAVLGSLGFIFCFCTIALCLWYKAHRKRSKIMKEQVELQKQQFNYLGGTNIDNINKAIEFLKQAEEMKSNPNAKFDMKNFDPTLLNFIQFQQMQLQNPQLNTDDPQNGQSGNNGGEPGDNDNDTLLNSDKMMHPGITDVNSNSELPPPPPMPDILKNLPMEIQNQYQIMRVDNVPIDTRVNNGEGDNITGMPKFNMGNDLELVEGTNNNRPLGPLSQINQRRLSKFEQKTVNIMQRNSFLGGNNVPLKPNSGRRVSILDKPPKDNGLIQLPPIPVINSNLDTPGYNYNNYYYDN